MDTHQSMKPTNFIKTKLKITRLLKKLKVFENIYICWYIKIYISTEIIYTLTISKNKKKKKDNNEENKEEDQT